MLNLWNHSSIDRLNVKSKVDVINGMFEGDQYERRLVTGNYWRRLAIVEEHLLAFQIVVLSN